LRRFSLEVLRSYHKPRQHPKSGQNVATKLGSFRPLAAC